jgi:cellulose synthase/poly-beta-1,6-N-acetylglucosamine synthase-like glycosyltransferase
VLVARFVFWLCAALVVYAQAGYGVLLALLARVGGGPGPAPPLAPDAELPPVSVIVAAYQEEAVIAEKVANLRALDYPADRVEIVVACDGSPDATPRRAREAGADQVLELPRGGKIRAQDAGVRAARGEIVAFSDANAFWEPDALRQLVAPFAMVTSPAKAAGARVGYVCGQVAFVNDGGSNQEGLYWRYEMLLRGLESRLASVTGGNGAIYATRREAYVEVDPIMGHDLSFPFTMVKRGWRALYAPDARATEKMVPSIEGEFARKRRMMTHGWPIVLRGGMLSPRGYSPLYALMIVSHRLLRYASPFLHAAVLSTSLVLARRSRMYAAALAAQLLVLAAAALAPRLRLKPFLVARYYVLTTAALAAGLYDVLREETEAGWEPPAGTR